MSKHEELRDIIVDMRAHGFTQLRRTTHGWLYGFQTFRISIPQDLKDNHRASSVALVRQEWKRLREEVRGANPGLAATVDNKIQASLIVQEVVEIEPIINIEDLVAAGAAADAAKIVVAPDPPHEMPQPPNIPFKGPYTEEDATIMATKLKCEKCHRTFGRPAALGRHQTAIHGLPHNDKRRQYEKHPAITSKPKEIKLFVKAGQAPIVIKADDYGTVLRDMVAATKKLEEAYTALLTERNHYKLERDELAARLSKFDALKGLFK